MKIPAKRHAVLAAAQLLLALLCARAEARYAEDRPEDDFTVRTRVKYWFSSASAQTRASMLTPYYWWSPPSDSVYMGRTDDFKRMNVSFPLYSAELRPVSGLSVEFEIGDSRAGKASFMQHEWLKANDQILYLSNGVVWDSPQHWDYSRSTADMTAEARQYTANLYLRVFKSRRGRLDDDFELNHTADLYVGFSLYEAKTHMTNGYQSLSTSFFLPTPPAGPIRGLDSTSRMTWYGWRAGFRDQAKLSDSFTAEAKFGFGPGLRFKGQDYWNLRTDLQNPGVRHSARGIAVEISASASWKFWKDFELQGGYMYWMYSAASGTETFLYTDGTRWEGTLDKVTASRTGYFTALSWKY